MSYVPTSYNNPAPTIHDDGDIAFWGTLLESGPGFRPSNIFPRFTDALFFYLDEHVAPQRSGYMEPSKIAFWMKAVSSNELPLDDLDAYNRIKFDVWKIPARIVTAAHENPQVGKQIVVLDRYGFMMYLLSAVRGEPDETFNFFRASISLFGLLDPLTHQRFPPMPRSSIPWTADAEAVQLEAQIASTVQVRHQANTQLALQQAHMQANNAIQTARIRAEISRKGNEAALAAITGGSYEYRRTYI